MSNSPHRRARRLTSLVAVGALAVTGLAATSTAQSASAASKATPKDGTVATLADKGSSSAHDLRSPLAQKQSAKLAKGLEARVNGDKTMQGKVGKLGKGQYVQLEQEGQDRVFVLLVEFGDAQYPNPIFQGPPKDGSATDVTGPLHNEIPKPDRSADNTTLWQADYSQAHYNNMYFTRMADYYKAQSSGRYTVTGGVSNWVKVPFNEALYGRNYCGGIVCATTKALVRDAFAVWVDNQLASGKTMDEIRAYLSTFDIEDRYDVDGDGNFDEPDGMIDHMQVVHAGGDEAAGDPHQGTDAIWSHRWSANLQPGGPLGVGFDAGTNGGLVSSPLVPNHSTGYWVYDYTIQPENGGLGVFAHEYAHDLGLPDLYDTSGNTGGAENSTAFWTLMSSGANIGDGGAEGIGDDPTDMSAWELLQLGWLQPQGKKGPFYDVAHAGKKSSHQIGSNVPATKKVQAVVTVLPEREVPLEIGSPYAGEHMYWSTRGDNLNTTMTHAAAAGTLSAMVNYTIEQDWDYAYLEASADGSTWTPVDTSRSTTTNPNSQNAGYGITGASNGWVQLTATLPTGTTQARFRYWTDVAATENGLLVDNVMLNGASIGTAESDEGWTFDGFVTSTGTEIQKFFNAYIAENRQYDGYDTSLKTAYNFGFQDSRPDWVESYPYQNGLLLWYWNNEYTDNNVGEHPGSGLLLPIDAHPQFSHWADGTLMRPRIQAYDSTFGLERTDPITLHLHSVAGSIASRPAVPVFDDTKAWWFNADEHAATGAHAGRYQPGWFGVDVPKTGTTIKVVSTSKQGNQINIQVAPK